MTTAMAVQLYTLTFLCISLCYAVSCETTTIAFSENDKTDVKLYINIVNPLDTVVHVNISAPRISSFPTRRELVEPKDVIVIDIDRTDFEITGTGKTGKGILIQSDASELILTGLSFMRSSSDMYFARNASQLGSEYVVITHCDLNFMCQFAVVAREDNTVIEITLPGYFAASIVLDGKQYGPSDVMTITLQESETFQIQSTSDLSGVSILSTNENLYSVLSGSPQTRVQSSSGRDYIADMVPPIAAWGNEYMIVRRSLTEYARDYVKFVAAASGANISIIRCGPVVYHQMLGFQIYLYNMTCERVHIISDKPVLIAHFPVGSANGDPAMFFPTPIDHYVSKYTVYIPPGFRYCAVALVMETVQVNTFNVSRFTSSFIQWKEIGQSVYSAAWLTNLESGVMEIIHTSPFGGHVICEKDYTIIALTIGLGNVTLNEPQEYSTTSTIAESTTIQSVDETSTDVTESTNGTSDVTITPNNSDDVTTSQSHTNTSGSILNCSCCKTASYSDLGRPSPEELLEMLNELKKTLLVPKKNTSKYIHKLTSAWDKRSSPAAIGALGIVVLCVVFGSIIAIDIATLFQRRR